MTFKIVVFLFGYQIVGAPLLAAVGHEHHSIVSWAFHHFPGDIHVFLRPHFPVFFN